MRNPPAPQSATKGSLVAVVQIKPAYFQHKQAVGGSTWALGKTIISLQPNLQPPLELGRPHMSTAAGRLYLARPQASQHLWHTSHCRGVPLISMHFNQSTLTKAPTARVQVLLLLYREKSFFY